VKRTSTLSVEPLVEQEKIKTKPETLHEEGSRELHQAVTHLANQMSDDLDEMVLETFGHRGRDNFDVHSLGFGDYVPPVAQEADLPDGMPQGSLCVVHGTGELFVYTGERWVACSVERDSLDRTTRVTIRHEIIEVREDGILRRDEHGETGPDSSDRQQSED